MIHTVSQGETAYSIANQYGVSVERLIYDNEIINPDKLILGQSLIILFPEITHQISPGESLYSISEAYNVPILNIIRNNPYIVESEQLSPGETIIIKYQEPKIGRLNINGYAYPYIEDSILSEALIFLSDLSIFSYGFDAQGNLIPVDDSRLIASAQNYDVSPILVLTPFGEDGKFNNNLITNLTNNPQARNNLINNLLSTVRTKGYYGVDVDFEFILPQDKNAYSNFVGELKTAMNNEGYRVSVALAPKTSANQTGALYEGIDYKTLGKNANSVLLMTYEWGYTYGPPMAVAPLNSVKKVLDFAITQIPASKIDMGMPNYGYDWPLPYVKGLTEAKVIGNHEALRIAYDNNSTIMFDNTAMLPYFEYSKNGVKHIIWFEDARSIDAKIRTAVQYGFRGIGYWNIMKQFRQNFVVLNSLVNII